MMKLKKASGVYVIDAISGEKEFYQAKVIL